MPVCAQSNLYVLGKFDRFEKCGNKAPMKIINTHLIYVCFLRYECKA